MQDPEDNRMYDELQEKKDNELLALAQKHAKDTGKSTACLPRKGIVKLVFENCPTWKKLYGKQDPRGAGMSIGRRIAKLSIPYEG
jgi:hypothetical protein